MCREASAAGSPQDPDLHAVPAQRQRERARESTRTHTNIKHRKTPQARPVTFNFDAEAHPTKVFPEGPQVGFIAQELERVLPNLVHTGADGFKSVAYDRVSVYALAGVKELAAAVRALSETAREQREAIDALRRELDARR